MIDETQENSFSPASVALREYVDHTGESLASIGRKTGIERSLLSKLIHGKTNRLRWDYTKSLAKVLDMPPELLGYG